MTHHIFFGHSENGRDFRLWALKCNLETNTAHEEEVVTTPQPSTSRASSTSRLSVLEKIGPLQAAPPKMPSNCGRKPMQSTVLTSPGSAAALKEKAAKRAAPHLVEIKKKKATAPAKPLAKRSKTKNSSPSDVILKSKIPLLLALKAY